MNTQTLLKRTCAGTVTFALLFSFLGGMFPQKAEAQLVVQDPINLIQNTVTALKAPITAQASISTSISSLGTQLSTTVSAQKDLKDSITDYVLKPLALAMGRAAIKSITNSTVNWINGGFQGSPAFATDLKKNLRQAADGEAQKFLNDLKNNSSIHSPFIDSLVTNVGTAYYLYSGRDALAARLKDTLSESSKNAAAFRAGDFQQGGWNAYWSTYMNPANNPFGAQMIASQALADRISGTIVQRTQELAWGSGFLSWRGDCIDSASVAPPDDFSGNVTLPGADGGGGTTITATSPATPLSDAEGCQEHEILTPGRFIEDKLNFESNSTVRQLELAQSIDAIVGALAQQLISQALGGSNGLRGASKPAQGGGASPATTGTGVAQAAVLTAEDGLAVAIQTSISQVTAWKNDSQAIVTLATSAQNICASVNQTTVTQLVAPALAKAQAAVTQADSLLATLNDLASQLQSSGDTTGDATRSAAYQTVTSSYQQLLNSSALPTPDVMGQAAADAKTSNNTVLPSLFDKLTALVSNNCQSTTQTSTRVVDPGF